MPWKPADLLCGHCSALSPLDSAWLPKPQFRGAWGALGVLALVLQEAEDEAEADVPETTEGKTHEGSRGGTGEGQENPQTSERREV